MKPFFLVSSFLENYMKRRAFLDEMFVKQQHCSLLPPLIQAVLRSLIKVSRNSHSNAVSQAGNRSGGNSCLHVNCASLRHIAPNLRQD